VIIGVVLFAPMDSKGFKIGRQKQPLLENIELH